MPRIFYPAFAMLANLVTPLASAEDAANEGRVYSEAQAANADLEPTEEGVYTCPGMVGGILARTTGVDDGDCVRPTVSERGERKEESEDMNCLVAFSRSFNL
jgi:hypothetical protein